jgi:hypothetical protein
MNPQILNDIKKLGGLLKKLSLISDNSFALFPSDDSLFEMPPDKYFEVVQRIFGSPSPLKAVYN